MKIVEGISKKFKEFGITSWSIDKSTVIYIVTILITLYGINKFNTLPKEQFPDITVPTISVSTIYVGNSPKDIENLVSQPIEKQLKSISGAKVNKVTSLSQQDFSLIIVEFETNIQPEVAKQKVKDAVDKAKSDLPNDLTFQPEVKEFSISEMPVLYVNVSGDFDGVSLKQYAERLQERFEDLKEITRADIVGAPEREIQVNVDPFKMQASRVSFNDIENAINRENRDISGGQVELGNMRRTIRVKGQFSSVYDLESIIIKNVQGAPIYLRDIAQLKDTVKEKESYARLDGKNVITINIVKRPGENLINAADKIKAIVANMQEKEELPRELRIQFTGDLSNNTKKSFNELINTIVIGFLLVLLVLMFFMGVTNAFFVALSVPLSVFVAFLFLPLADWFVGGTVTLNFIVLFALLFGLGIIVDDAIVVIENTHRIYNNGKVPIVKAAKEAAGEVWMPVLAGTLTTLAPFFPLLLWKGLVGKFMVYLPVMLILTLSASLIVAFIFNPVFAVSFMKPEGRDHERPARYIFRQWWFWSFLVFGVLFHLMGWHGFGNFLLLLPLLSVINVYVIRHIIHGFQHDLLPRLMDRYEQLLRWALKGYRPVWLLISLFIIFPISVAMIVLRGNGVQFFPKGDPNFIYVYLKMPVGTDIKTTDSVTRLLEDKVYKVLGKDQPGATGSIVESVIANVAVSANNPRDNNRSTQPNLGRIQISFVEFEKRHGKLTRPYMDAMREAVKDIPGTEISVNQEDMGPPTEAPVNIEVIGENFESIAKVAFDLKNYLDTNKVEGVEALNLDVDPNNPEISVIVDREKVLAEGLSTAQVGMEIRTAVFGKEVSKIKQGDDEYKIQLRYSDLVRNNVTDLMNMRITFRDFNTMAIKQIPLNAVAHIEYTNTSGGVRRKNYRRTIQLQSNVLNESAVTSINAAIGQKIETFKATQRIPQDVTIRQTGVSEQQLETISFLG
ncbi:MAG: hypothetical protein RL732_1639, partial [Bacteroidota bacterium]